MKLLVVTIKHFHEIKQSLTLVVWNRLLFGLSTFKNVYSPCLRLSEYYIFSG